MITKVVKNYIFYMVTIKYFNNMFLNPQECKYANMRILLKHEYY